MTDTATSSADAKSWLASRTIWFNIVVFVLDMATRFGLTIEIEPELLTQISIALATVGNILLRLVTSRPVRVLRKGSADTAMVAPFAVLLVLALVLAACASTVARTPAQRVFALQADYTVALSAAVTYESLPRCAPAVPAPCSAPAVVAEIRRADAHAFDALREAQLLVRSGALDGDAVELAITTGAAAIRVLTRALQREGVL